jgi:hypothetical protein
MSPIAFVSCVNGARRISGLAWAATTQVVVLEQTCRVEKTASKITDVDGGKRVRGAGVAVMESSDTCTVT